MNKLLLIQILILFFTYTGFAEDTFTGNDKNLNLNKAKPAMTPLSGKNYTLYEKIFINGKFQTIDGKSIEISKLKTPVVIYNFWATWCTPCMREIPSMIAMKKKFNDDKVVVMAFNTDETNQLTKIDKAKKKLNLRNEFNIIADTNSLVARSFKCDSLPVTIIFSHGKIVFINDGPVDFNTEEMIENLNKWSANS